MARLVGCPIGVVVQLWARHLIPQECVGQPHDHEVLGSVPPPDTCAPGARANALDEGRQGGLRRRGIELRPQGADPDPHILPECPTVWRRRAADTASVHPLHETGRSGRVILHWGVRRIPSQARPATGGEHTHGMPVHAHTLSADGCHHAVGQHAVGRQQLSGCQVATRVSVCKERHVNPLEVKAVRPALPTVVPPHAEKEERGAARTDRPISGVETQSHRLRIERWRALVLRGVSLAT
mmetsp:Transcript_34309/g.91692  ORF Transcript_34309/g.91692 Transcript_34309/m.91692 type:complete len:239 (-) Transcript_34309:1103-1819(-)